MTKSRGIYSKRGSRLAWVERERGKHTCECECGGVVPIRAEHFNIGIPRFIHGHNAKLKPPKPRKPIPPRNPCECGCGELASPGKQYVAGWHARKGQHHSEETREKIRLANTGPNSHMWGKRSPRYKGRVRAGTGYVYLYKPEHPFSTKAGYIMEHRLVLEEHLRTTDPTSPHLIGVGDVLYLRPELEVHHDDETKTNNVVGNLVAMTKAEHAALHQRLRKAT